jgi:hypothetical protein
MNGDFVFQWQMLVYPLAALGYFELMRRLDNYWANRTPLTDEEILWNTARMNGISELEVFFRAGDSWSMDRNQVEEDFKIYLKNERLPHYVRDYLRKLRPLIKARP